MNTCKSYCTAVRYNFKECSAFLESHYKTTKYKNFCIVYIGKWLCFIFEYGVVVHWNLSYNDEQSILQQLADFEIETIQDSVFDHFWYEENSGAPIKISNDTIYLQSDNEDEKIGVSQWLAQSIKLSFFETTTTQTIESTSSIPTSLATTGDTGLNSTAISKMRGELFLAKSRINLHYDLLDSPEFFWEYPELLPYYESTAHYLEIRNRIEVLNKKLEILHEMFNMLADEQKHHHSSFLEWIIIWLIVIEIFFTVFHDILHWF